MDNQKPNQQNRKRDEESRTDRADLANQDAAPPPANEPAERDESGKTAAPQNATGLPPNPANKPEDRTATGKQ